MKKYEDKILHEAYYEEILPSGFKVYLYPKKGILNKGAYLTVGYGGFYTDFITASGEHIVHPAGTAHFLEHKLFEDRDNRILEEMGKLGANVNAFTSHDITSFYFTSPIHFEEALSLLLEIPAGARYSDEGIAAEREVIKREIEMYDDNVDYLAYHSALKTMYPCHPVGTDIAGTKDSIEQIDRRVLDQVMEHFYTPENMYLFLIGDFTKENLRHFVDLLPPFYHKARPTARVQLLPDLSRPSRKVIRDTRDTESPSFSYLLKLDPTPAAGSEFIKDLKMGIILDVLFGKGSSFYHENYEKGILSDLDAHYARGDGYRYIHISGEGKHPESFRRAVRKLLQTVGELQIDNDVAMIKKKLIGRYIMGFNSISNIAFQFMEAHFDKVSMYDFLTDLRDLTIGPEDLRFEGTAIFSIIRKEKQ